MSENADDEVDRAPLARHRVEGGVDGGDVLDVAIDEEARADLGGQRPQALAEGLALIGEGDLRALIRQGLRGSPGDGIVVRDTHDDAALSLHQIAQEPVLRQFCTRWKTSVALVPPKPNELVRTVSILASSTRVVTIGSPSNSGSSSSIWALLAMKRSRIMISE